MWSMGLVTSWESTVMTVYQTCTWVYIASPAQPIKFAPGTLGLADETNALIDRD